MAFWYGVLATMAVGLILAIVFDEDVRNAALTIGWALLIGPPVMLWMALLLLSSQLPERFRPRRVRGRRLSARALQRVADHAQHHGWIVSRPSAAILVLKRKKG